MTHFSRPPNFFSELFKVFKNQEKFKKKINFRLSRPSKLKKTGFDFFDSKKIFFRKKKIFLSQKSQKPFFSILRVGIIENWFFFKFFLIFGSFKKSRKKNQVGAESESWWKIASKIRILWFLTYFPTKPTKCVIFQVIIVKNIFLDWVNFR